MFQRFGILGLENLAFEAEPWKLVVFKGIFEKIYEKIFWEIYLKNFLRKLFRKVYCPLNLHMVDFVEEI
jgi:hypothetical protein